MNEQQVHHGFLITVTTHDERSGGSKVTLIFERMLASGDDIRRGMPAPEPERYHSLLKGPAAIGEAIDRTKHAIDDALGECDPLDDD